MSEPVLHMAWRDAARKPLCRTADSGTTPSRWIEYEGLTGHDCRIEHLALPAGQRCEATGSSGGTVLAGVEGTVAVQVGPATHHVHERDLLALPAGLAYALHNASDTQAAFLCTVRAHGAAGMAPVAQGQVLHVSRETSVQQLTWTLPFANTWGHHRGSGPYVSPEGLRGHMVSLPLGQASPWHHAPRDLYFLGMDGVVEFQAVGQCVRLESMDLLHVQSGTPYRYCNVAAGDAFFLSIGGAAARGAKGVYYQDDPGWPVRADARILDTDADPYAGLRAQA